MDTWTLTIKSEDYFNGKDEIISKFFDKNVNKKLNIKNITIILPETKAPYYHGNNDYKNVQNFPYFFKKVLIIFKNLEEIDIINLWPWSPIYIFSDFEDIKDNYIKNGDVIANKLKKLNLGFLGYNVLEVNMLNENIIDFLGLGFFKHLDRISWKTRCSCIIFIGKIIILSIILIIIKKILNITFKCLLYFIITLNFMKL